MGSCSPSFRELLLVLPERALYREASVLQFFTESSERLEDLHCHHFDPEKWKKLYSEVTAAVYLLCNPFGNFEYLSLSDQLRITKEACGSRQKFKP